MSSPILQISHEITSHEMLRRFAVGEVFSRFITNRTDIYRHETLQLLQSGNVIEETQGICRAISGRLSMLSSLPSDIRWFLSKLMISEEGFSQLKTLNDKGWNRYSDGTRRILDAANYLKSNPGTDPGIDQIISNFSHNRVEMQGITLIGQSIYGPFTILEGNGRMVAITCCCIAESKSIEVVAGISPEISTDNFVYY